MRNSLQRMAEIGLTDPQDERVMNREKVKLALYTMYTYSFMDSANLCQFVYGPAWQLIGPAEMAELASAVTGWPLAVVGCSEWMKSLTCGSQSSVWPVALL